MTGHIPLSGDNKEAYTSRTLLVATGFDPHVFHSIYVVLLSLLAAESKVFLIQSDFLSEAFDIADFISASSSGKSLMAK